MALDQKPIDDLELERGLTPEPEQEKPAGEKIKEGQRQGGGLGSLLGILALAPLGIYSYLNSPNRYSAAKLEKEAQKYARNKVKEIVASAKKTKTYTTEEKNTFHQMSLEGYYDGYVRDHQERADMLAKKSTNQQLLSAIERRDKENEINNKKIVSEQKTEPQPEQHVSTFTPVVPTGIIPSVETPSSEPIAPSSSTASGSGLPSVNMPTPSGVRPSAPSIPGEKTPKIPGVKRNLPHLPKPGLPGLPNPIQNIRTLAFFLNPTNVIMFTLFGLILSTFLIVLMMGGPGVGLNSNPVSDLQPPVCTGGAVQPLPISEVEKIIKFGYEPNSSHFSGMGGTTAQHPTDKEKAWVLNVFSKVLGSTRFRELLFKNNRPVYLYFYHTSPSANWQACRGGFVGGGAQNENQEAFCGMLQFIDAGNYLNGGLEKMLIHETTHILNDRRNISDGSKAYGGDSYSRSALAAADPKCYSNVCRIYDSLGHLTCSSAVGKPYIRSYSFRDSGSCRADSGRNAESESLADAVAYYVVCPPGKSCNLGTACAEAIKYNSSDGKSGDCPTTYEWIKKNIYGGDDFFATDPSTCVPPDAGGGGQAANSNNCGGAYTSWFKKITTEPIYQCTGKWADPVYAKSQKGYECASFLHNETPNFGDPACTLTSSTRGDLSATEMDGLSQQIAKYDSSNVRKWLAIIACESSYHANSFNPFSQSQKGAYGLVQMNPSGKGNSQYDAGDVSWDQQVKNAIDYKNKTIGGSFAYWACAR